jgi:hypothetical protein
MITAKEKAQIIADLYGDSTLVPYHKSGVWTTQAGGLDASYFLGSRNEKAVFVGQFQLLYDDRYFNDNAKVPQQTYNANFAHYCEVDSPNFNRLFQLYNTGLYTIPVGTGKVVDVIGSSFYLQSVLPATKSIDHGSGDITLYSPLSRCFASFIGYRVAIH